MTYVLYKGWKESSRVLKDYSNISLKMPNNPKTLFNRGCTAYLVGFSFWVKKLINIKFYTIYLLIYPIFRLQTKYFVTI